MNSCTESGEQAFIRNPLVAMKTTQHGGDMEKTKHGGDMDVAHVHVIAQCVFILLFVQWH